MALINLLLSSAYMIIFHNSSDASRTAELNLEEEKPKMENFVGAAFQMPLHYPRYVKSDYEKMEEWKLDMLLREYGLNFNSSLEEKRRFAMGAFLWPDQF
ncbi:hypothetical protein ACJIZ3_007019 [Penstemon smallii]|uniref:DUF7722 domain-containing protein n=1 Tax=Penstemon smallii TaxID=265156 RepID=A0ABD3S9E9_9LAMI